MLDMLYAVNVYGALAAVLEGGVSKAKREAPVEFWKKKIEEAVQDNQLAEEGEW